MSRPLTLLFGDELQVHRPGESLRLQHCPCCDVWTLFWVVDGAVPDNDCYFCGEDVTWEFWHPQSSTVTHTALPCEDSVTEVE